MKNPSSNDMSMTEQNLCGVYIHIPFCSSKCHYCDFVSAPFDLNVQQNYIDALCKEVENIQPSIQNLVSQYINNKVNTCDIIKADTVYIGGGTPSVLYSGGLVQVFKQLKNNIYIAKNAEITIECNPNSVTQKKIEEWVECGVNRVSIGLQSTNQDLLETIGRKQTLQSFKEAIQQLAKYFDNISVDIMYGLPNQSLNDLEQTLQQATKFATHISAYALSVEKNTKLYQHLPSGLCTLPDDDEVADMYQFLVEFLNKLGFQRYEVSNFAKPNRQSRHNKKYWDSANYLGLGVSAHSKIDDIRFCNTNDIQSYIDTNGKLKKTELLQLDTKIIEFLMLGFRQTKGINLLEYQSIFGHDFCNKYQKTLDNLLTNNILQKSQTNISIKSDKFFVLNQIINQFL